MHFLRDPPVVLAEERDLAMELYLVALGTWLVLPPRLWHQQLLDVSPQGWGWPGPWVAVVLATTLVHCVGRPLDMTAAMAGVLRGGGFPPPHAIPP